MIGYDIKNYFFDRRPVLDMVGKKTAGFLNRAGGSTRLTARRLQRPAGKKGKSAAPGEPPRYHSKDPVRTLRNILYGYDPHTRTVIVGPVLLTSRKSSSTPSSGKTVPQTQEKGGAVVMRSRRGRGKKKPRQRRVQVAPHPFMAPALKKTTERFSELWYGASS